MNRAVRLIRAVPLAMALALSTPSASLAQEVDVPGEPGEGEGNPLFGYLAAGAGSIAVLFVLCISARR